MYKISIKDNKLTVKLVYHALGHEKFFLNNDINLILPNKFGKKIIIIVFDIIMTWVVNINFELNVLESENGDREPPLNREKDVSNEYYRPAVRNNFRRLGKEGVKDRACWMVGGQRVTRVDHAFPRV